MKSILIKDEKVHPSNTLEMILRLLSDWLNIYFFRDCSTFNPKWDIGDFFRLKYGRSKFTRL